MVAVSVLYFAMGNTLAPATREWPLPIESNHRMSQQPILFSSQVPVTPPRLAARPPQDAKPPRQSPRWLQRLDLFVRVIVRLYLGLVIVVLPCGHDRW